METNWPVVISVAVLFPAFGAAVFVWWRRQYGVRSGRGVVQRGVVQRGDRRVVVLRGPEGAPAGGEDHSDDGHARQAAPGADPEAKDHA